METQPFVKEAAANAAASVGIFEGFSAALAASGLRKPVGIRCRSA